MPLLQKLFFNISEGEKENMKHDIDLVLINPGDRKKIYQSLGAEFSAIEPPIWTSLIATFIRKHGYSVHVVDSNAENLSPEETVKRVKELNPLLVAVVAYGHNPSASTQVMPYAGAVCTAIKQFLPDLKIFLVGGHVAALPEITLKRRRCRFCMHRRGALCNA